LALILNSQSVAYVVFVLGMFACGNLKINYRHSVETNKYEDNLLNEMRLWGEGVLATSFAFI